MAYFDTNAVWKSPQSGFKINIDEYFPNPDIDPAETEIAGDRRLQRQLKKEQKHLGAAGKIHSDIERGFIRAEIVSYDDLVKYGSMTKVKEQGLVRMEGKDYIMKDGDIVDFKFNV